MKILWLSSVVPYPPKGGVLQRSYNLLRETARYHEVDLLGFNQRALMNMYLPDSGVQEAQAAVASFCGRTHFVDVPCDRIFGGKYLLAAASLCTDYPYTINWQRSREFARICRQWSRERDYDIVHCDMITVAPYRSLVTASAATLGHHNVESHLLERRAQQTGNKLVKWYLEQESRRLAEYERRICPTFDWNLMCSELDCERLARIAPSANSTLIPNGVDLGYFRPGTENSDTERLIFAGMLNWEPNRHAVEYIVEVLWPRLKQRRPGLRIDIVGPNPPQCALAMQERDPDFVVHGYVNDIRPFIARSSLYLCPIQDGGGTKLKVLDAFAMGKAVVADPIACEGLNVTDGRDVVLAHDPDDYVASVERLLDRPREREAIGRRATELVEREYSFSSIGRTLSSLFEQTVQSRSAAAASGQSKAG